MPGLFAGKYQTSLLKAFQRTVDEARFAVVVVDAPNLRVEDVKPYWAAGQVLHACHAPPLVAVTACVPVFWLFLQQQHEVHLPSLKTGQPQFA